MMKIVVVFALIGYVCCDGIFQGKASLDKFAGKYVYDLLKPALQPAEVMAIETSKGVGAYPTLNSIPSTKFDCASKAGPGFYADVEAQCQLFHRCDPNGNQTDYLCVNTTIFNQITLICDKWYNVDCSGSVAVENFANSRLYTDKPLFDTPPAGYIAPSQKIAEAVNVAAVQAGGKAVSSGRSDETAPAAGNSVGSETPAAPAEATTTAAPPAADAGAATTAAAASADAGAATTAAAVAVDAGAATTAAAAPADAGAAAATPAPADASAAAAVPAAAARRRRNF